MKNRIRDISGKKSRELLSEVEDPYRDPVQLKLQELSFEHELQISEDSEKIRINVFRTYVHT